MGDRGMMTRMRWAPFAMLWATAWTTSSFPAQSSCSWTDLGNGVSGANVEFLTTYDDGTGLALYGAGDFGAVGGSHMARWNGAAWVAIGGGANAKVTALAAYDAGSGPSLYAAGFFTMIGGVAANRIARWDGTVWHALGLGLDSWAHDLEVFDDGTGPALYVGGVFSTAGGLTVNRIAKWNGIAWSPLGSGANNQVNQLEVYDDGTGSALFAGGGFLTMGGITVNRIARWNGTAWSAVGSGLNGEIYGAMTVFDDGDGPALYVGGPFTMAGVVPASHVARWNGSVWSALGSGIFGSTTNRLKVIDVGSGPMLYVSGTFTTAGGLVANNVACWSGSMWSALGGGVNGWAAGLTGFDDGSGPALFLGGTFTTAGGAPANHVARWSCAPMFAVQVTEPSPGAIAMTVTNAAANTALYTLISTAIVPPGTGPFFGLDPSAFVLFLALYPLPPFLGFANGAGQYSFSAPTGTVPTPFPTQWRVLQPTAPAGLAMSNVVTLTF